MAINRLCTFLCVSEIVCMLAFMVGRRGARRGKGGSDAVLSKQLIPGGALAILAVQPSRT